LTRLSLEEERRLVLLFAIDQIGGAATKRSVLDWIETEELHVVDPAEAHMVRSKEPAWRNSLAWDRDKLVKRGALANTARNDWRLTEAGRAYLTELSARIAEADDLAYINPFAASRILSTRAIGDDHPWAGETVFLEGSRSLVWTVRYERNAILRDAAIAVHGTQCQCCNFDFAKTYGALGAGFIEVHHTKPVSSLECETAVDAKTDLVVLCSNCHRMIHRRGGSPLTLDEVRAAMHS
jgi:predicted HNH restriction endonuclease